MTEETQEPKLTNKQKLFIDEYLKSFNATGALSATMPLRVVGVARRFV